ncbi:MAG TPA: hypothetical protein VKK79_17340 [Candidatus Lokiarchaeia archaeon]|nr:hypothetical protein [Candidatus Lokiarchaeia archaeon]
MTWFKCDKCGYTFQGEEVPQKCPSCKKKCTFLNVTCYTPDCGHSDEGEEHLDPNLV